MGIESFGNLSTDFANRFKQAADDQKINKSEVADLQKLATSDDDKKVLEMITKDKTNVILGLREGDSEATYDLAIDLNETVPEKKQVEAKPTVHTLVEGLTASDDNNDITDGVLKVDLKSNGIPQEELDKTKFVAYKGTTDFNKTLKGKDFAIKRYDDKGPVFTIRPEFLKLDGLPEPKTKIKVTETKAQSQKIADLQQFMKEYGAITDKTFDVDGCFGPRTLNAVAIAYQMAIQKGDTEVLTKLAPLMADLAEKFKDNSTLGAPLQNLSAIGQEVLTIRANVETALKKGAEIVKNSGNITFQQAADEIGKLKMPPNTKMEFLKKVIEQKAGEYSKEGGLNETNIQDAQKLLGFVQEAEKTSPGIISPEAKTNLDTAINNYLKKTPTKEKEAVKEKTTEDTKPLVSSEDFIKSLHTGLTDTAGIRPGSGVQNPIQSVALLQLAAKNGVLDKCIKDLSVEEKAVLIKHLIDNKSESNLSIAREILNISVDKDGKPEKDKILDSSHLDKDAFRALFKDEIKPLKDFDKDKIVDKKVLKDALINSVDGRNNNESALTMVKAINSGGYDDVFKDIPAGNISDLMGVVKEHGSKDDLSAFYKKLADVPEAKTEKLDKKDKVEIFRYKIEKDPDNAMKDLAKQDADYIKETIKTIDLKQSTLAILGKELAKYPGKIDDLVDGASDQKGNNPAVKILSAMIKDFAEKGGGKSERDQIQSFINGIKKDWTEKDDVMDSVLSSITGENKLHAKDIETQKHLEWLISGNDNPDSIMKTANSKMPYIDIFSEVKPTEELQK